MSENQKKLATLVSRRFKILDTLYPDKEYYMKELAEESDRDRATLSKYVEKLKEANLVSTREERKRPKGRPRKYVTLTGEAREIIHSFHEALKPEEIERELGDPDEQEIKFLIEQIEEPESEEVHDQAVNDLLKICKETRVWDFEYPSSESLEDGKVWPLLKNLLKGNENECKKGLSFLLTVLKNSSRENREKVVESIRELFESDIKELAGIEPYSKPTQILEIILTKEEDWNFYASKLKEAIRKNRNLNPVLPKLERFRKWNRKKLRRWFYELLSDDDPEVREAVQQLYNQIM